MKFSTESGKAYNLTAIDENTYPPKYLVETDQDGERVSYSAELIAPNHIMKGLGVIFMTMNKTGVPEYVHTEPVIEIEDRRESIGDSIAEALDSSATDFRTIDSLAEQLGVDQSTIRLGIAGLGDAVRQPMGHFARRYPDWYRLTSHGPTNQERLHGYE